MDRGAWQATVHGVTADIISKVFKYWKAVMLLIVASESPASTPPNSNFPAKAQVFSATKIVSCFLLCGRVSLFIC